MAAKNNTMVLTLEDKEVAFAILAGEGRQGKKPEKEYVVGVKVTPDERDEVIEKIKEFWEENKPSKNAKPKESFDHWFSEKDGDIVFWASEVASKPLTRKRATGTSYGLKEFETIGAGSKVDVAVRFFIYSNSFGDGIGMRLNAVKLNEYVKFTGGAANLLGGDIIGDDDIVEDSTQKGNDEPKEKKEKKEKKKKKDKKKDK